MEIDIDVKTVSEAGFDTYLSRALFDNGSTSISFETRYSDPSSFVGGTIGGEGIIYLGSKQFRLDGKNKRITIENKILIGYAS